MQIIEYEGKTYAEVSVEKAFEIRSSVQLYVRLGDGIFLWFSPRVHETMDARLGGGVFNPKNQYYIEVVD